MGKKIDEIPISNRLDTVLDGCMEQLKREQREKKRRRRKKIYISFSTAAAIFAGAVFLGVSNPDAAERIPLLGHIFELMQDNVSYEGNYSEHAEQLLTEEELMKGGTDEIADNEYVQESNGTTITVSEIYHDYVAMYMTVQISSEDGFPEEMISDVKQKEHGRMELLSEIHFDFFESPITKPSYIEGNFINSNTYIGIVRVPIHNLHETMPDTETLNAAGVYMPLDKGEYAPEDIRLLHEKFPDVGKKVEVPKHFTFNWSITTIYDWDLMLNEYVNTEEKSGMESFILQNGYHGDWDFNFDVELDSSQCEIIEINETNAEGDGILRIIKTPSEITANLIMPNTKLPDNYYTVFCDANGNSLEPQEDSYNITNRDISTVYVFLCDGIHQLDLKEYCAAPDYKENKKTKTYAEYLREYALYSTTVHFD